MPYQGDKPVRVEREDMATATLAFGGDAAAALQAGFVRGYKAAHEDNDLDVPSDADAARAAKDRF